MEGNVARAKAAVLRGAVKAEQGAHAKVSRLQVQAATEANVYSQWKENENIRVQGNVIIIKHQNKT